MAYKSLIGAAIGAATKAATSAVKTAVSNKASTSSSTSSSGGGKLNSNKTGGSTTSPNLGSSYGGGGGGSSSSSTSTYAPVTTDQNSILAQMQANSAAWHNASPSEKARLEAENKSLGAKIGGTYNSTTGTWSNAQGGALYGPSTSVGQVTGTTPNAQQTPGQIAGNPLYPNAGGTDYAALLLKQMNDYINSGGQSYFDWNTFNQNADARNAKIASNAELQKYSTTDDLVGQLLKTVQYMEKAYDLEQQMANGQVPANQPPIEQPVVSQETQQLNDLIDYLTNVSQSPSTAMSFDEAQARAAGELNPMYADAASRLASGLNADMEQRGIYNSPLASAILTEKQGQLSNEQISSIAARAQQLLSEDREMTLAEKQNTTNTLNNLISSLIGREVNLANLTGTYNGSPTWDAQMDLADLTGYYNGTSTLARQQYESQKALAEGELTGQYNGQSTLAAREFNLEAEMARLNQAMNQVQLLGSVSNQSLADALGVPVGTSSFEAQNAAANRAMELQMFNSEMGYKRSALASQNRSQSASDLLAQFNKDMIIWETTGSAPNTPAMQYYGIAPGTEYSDPNVRSAVNQYEQYMAQQELEDAQYDALMSQRGGNLSKQYGLDANTGYMMATVLDQGMSEPELQNWMMMTLPIINNDRESGINTEALRKSLLSYYSLMKPYQTTLK